MVTESGQVVKARCVLCMVSKVGWMKFGQIHFGCCSLTCLHYLLHFAFPFPHIINNTCSDTALLKPELNWWCKWPREVSVHKKQWHWQDVGQDCGCEFVMLLYLNLYKSSSTQQNKNVDLAQLAERPLCKRKAKVSITLVYTLSWWYRIVVSMTGFDPVDQSSNLCITSFPLLLLKTPSHSGIAAVYGTVVPGFDSQRGLSNLKFCSSPPQ